MEIFKDTNYDFLSKRWLFIGISVVMMAAGLISIAVKGGLRYGIDFKGGTLMTVKWAGAPPVDQIRKAVTRQVGGEVSVYELHDLSDPNLVALGTELKDERELNANRRAMQDTLEATFGQPGGGKLDFSNAGQQALISRLRDPLQRAGVQVSDPQLQTLVADMLNFRNTPPRSGLLSSFDQLASVPGVNSGMISVLKQECYLAPFSIRQVEVVGPKVGAELRRKAILATLYALAGMLVYIAFRFQWIYGVGAVLAVFHDTLVTVGLFSMFDKEINLTVIAALLTLVGYSMNDTIVIFDRIRENLRLTRREPLESLMNRSINQTLGRTVMTSGLTFLAVLALFLFGGPVLHPFSFALVVGIIVGSYSTIFVASPLVLMYYNWSEKRKGRASPAAAPVKPQESQKQAVGTKPTKAVK